MKFLLAFLFVPSLSFAQPALTELTGLWKGYVSTSEKQLPYELVITEKDGKLFGYAHTTFTVDGKDIVSVKKVSVRIQNQSIIVEDDDLLFDNFDAEAPKKIKQTNTLFFKDDESKPTLTGTFESKATRTMRPARGSVVLEKKYTDEDTKLIAKLTDLKLENTISFVLTAPGDIAVNNKKTTPPPIASTPTVETTKVTNTDPFIASTKPEVKKDTPVNTIIATIVTPMPVPEVKKDTAVNTIIATVISRVPMQEVKKDTPVNSIIATVVTPAPMAEIVPELPVLARQLYKPQTLIAGVQASKPNVSTRKYVVDNRTIAFLRYRVTQPVISPTLPGTIAATNPVVKQDNSVAKANPTPTNPATRPATINPSQPVVKQPASPAIVRANVAVAPVVDLSKRTIETIDELTIQSDSLVFSLYDNGTVDGDSVSIILNGKTIISKQMLSTIAITKTIYLTPDMGDSVQLVMYAENLGTIAPNTGLLVLLYDNKRREIRFSGDLNKNAAITLRRRPKG